MAKSSNLTNYEKYLNNVKLRGYANLPIPDHEETIEELLIEGDRLIRKEESQKSSPTITVNPPPKASSNNPYFQARQKILSEMDSEKRKLIERLEKEGNTDSYQYQDFVEQIRKLGDQLSS